MKQFKDTNGAFIIPLKENDKIFWIMHVKIQRWASGSKKNILEQERYLPRVLRKKL